MRLTQNVMYQNALLNRVVKFAVGMGLIIYFCIWSRYKIKIDQISHYLVAAYLTFVYRTGTEGLTCFKLCCLANKKFQQSQQMVKCTSQKVS